MEIDISGPEDILWILLEKKQRIQEYIKRQLEQDQIADQLSLKEFTDPFTGSKGTKA